MLRLNDSTGVTWCEELPDDPANLGGGLDGVSPVDYSNIMILGQRTKFSQSSNVIVLCLSLLTLEVKSPLTIRQVMHFFRLKIFPTSLAMSSSRSPSSSLRFISLSYSFDMSITSLIHFLASLEKIL